MKRIAARKQLSRGAIAVVRTDHVTAVIFFLLYSWFGLCAVDAQTVTNRVTVNISPYYRPYFDLTFDGQPITSWFTNSAASFYVPMRCGQNSTLTVTLARQPPDPYFISATFFGDPFTCGTFPEDVCSYCTVGYSFDGVYYEADTNYNCSCGQLGTHFGTCCPRTLNMTFYLKPVCPEPCPVDMLRKPKFPSLGYDESGLTQSMLTAITGFENAIGSANIFKTSGYRSQAYQDHLYEIWSHANALQQVSGIQVISSNPLQLSAIPGCPVCQAVVDELNPEIANHFPNTFPVAVAKHSLHTTGNAVDWTIINYSESQISAIATTNNLNWKVPGEPWHFSLKTAPVGHGVLVAAHSPVNILVTDPNGRKVGYDPIASNVVNEIGAAATFSGVATTPQTVEIEPSAVLFGQYLISGIGTGTGTYTIDINVDTTDSLVDTVLTVLATGVAQTNQPIAAIPPINAVATTLQLTYQIEAGNIILNGPTWASNAVVEWTTNFSANSWSTLPGNFDPVNGRVATNQIVGTKFFRLRLP